MSNSNSGNVGIVIVSHSPKIAEGAGTFPGQIVHGHVDSIAPASGQEFALGLPNWLPGHHQSPLCALRKRCKRQ